MLSLAEELLLLALDDETGKLAGSGSRLDCALAGAVLCDLVLCERVAIVGDRVALRADGLTGEPANDRVLVAIARREKPRAPEDWVRRLARDVRKDVIERLQERGLVRAERRRILGVLPAARYPESDPGAEDAARARIRSVLVDGADAEPRTAALIAIALAAGIGRTLVADRPWKEIEPRARAIAAGDWAGAAVGRAIASVKAAVAAATVAATSAASVAGS